MTPHEQRAWARLTADMAGDMHQYDYWEDASENVRQIYLDRILLEDAARAAGIELVWSTQPDLSPRRKDNYHAWNPLRDDGDALRLAVKLRLNVYQNQIGRFVSAHNAAIEKTEMLGADDDPYAATRRAIVRAAAALAPALPA